MTFTATEQAQAIVAELDHPPSAAVAVEIEELRTRARLLMRSYGPCAHRVRELLRIETRHRYLRGLLRDALGEAEPTSTRTRSAAAFGTESGPRASWRGQL